MTSASLEHNHAFAQYCEAIFELEEDSVDVIQARIAERLDVSRPAVSEMVRRLDAEGLVRLGSHIELTDAGRHLAESVVRRHRLAERMLTDVLGLNWADAHTEASKWEHVISPTVELAMNRLLDEPTTCPHGNPIPGSQYEAPDTVMLSDLTSGEGFVVRRIPEELEFEPGMLTFLDMNSLRPGETGRVTAASPDGTLTLSIAGQHVGLSASVASKVMVTRE
ncbi:MAG: metal-dependent transcriptional regulator [Actinomycetota bacterium]|nr:metal-dependent transcriptional regulator [Actinomycetota bacterium]